MSDEPTGATAAGPPEATARENEILRSALRDSNAERATLKGLLARAGSTLPMGFRRSPGVAEAQTHPRIAILERVRLRLSESNERLVRERDEARERATALEAALAERGNTEDEVSSRFVALRERLESTEDALTLAEAHVRELSARREFDSAHVCELEQTLREFERWMASSAQTLSRNAALVHSLAEAHERAAESIATLEHDRRQLEFELASRLTLAETKAIDTIGTIGQLVAERALLADTLALRERRIANLEGALRDVTVDFVRATELELRRYRDALASLEASPIGKLRVWLRRLLRPVEAPVLKKRTIRLSRRPGRKRSKTGADRHLRSA